MPAHVFVSHQAPPLPQSSELRVEIRRSCPSAQELDPRRPTVLVLSSDWNEIGEDARQAIAAQAALVVIGAVDERVPRPGSATSAIAWLPADASPELLLTTLLGAVRHAEALTAAHTRHDELTELARVGAALSTERDLTALLQLILSQARRLALADAGSLYLMERDADGTPTAMRFAVAQNHSLPDLPFRETTVPIDATSLAGYAAVAGTPLVIDDVYALAAEVPYRFNRSFDEAVGYRTKSVLVLPMRSHRDEIVGVLQLINCKEDASIRLSSPAITDAAVIPFPGRIVELVAAMASQAAVALENGRLYEDIERLFEGFVTASILAVEQRDPTTAGHSFRVTAYTMGLAGVLNAGHGIGAYRDTRFTRAELRELRYACLLHDFGKVAVREAVLQKEKKLYPIGLSNVQHRAGHMLLAIDLAAERARVAHLRTHGTGGFDEVDARIEAERSAAREALREMLRTILSANEPMVLTDQTSSALDAIARVTYRDAAGTEQPLLTADDVRYLSIPRGNLDEQERAEIESHATHSHEFLDRIAWTPELRNIPSIVWGHHEKMNGRGYPRGVGAGALSVQTRMMTIADIFDALVAADRPYKRAIPVDRALAILREEARDGALDADLLETFIRASVWELVDDEVRARTREARSSTPTRTSLF
jgi:HD-GYP domain-containing protein (c-di-GMP phosphodiesterase class II)